jgi:hypothetical protein
MPKKEDSQPQKRVYGNEIKLESDLFKLLEAKMKKNVALYPKIEKILDEVTHTHFFRTFDSDGRPQKYCSPVGGHFHVVETVPPKSPGEAATILSVGPALMKRFKTVHGQQVQVIEPYMPGDDNHTHEFVYMRTCDVQGRQVSAAAAMLIGAAEAKLAPIPGIIG